MQWLPDSPAAPALVALASAALLAWGRRGRRVDDHPICRRCGFDLVGRPQGSTACSECGASLRRRRSIRHGARRRVRGAMTVALLLLVPSLGVLAFHGYTTFTEVPGIRRKPVWWLLNDAASRDAVVRDDAFNELAVRLRGGRLSGSQVGQVVDRALEIQADRRKVWFPQWGDFVKEAYRAGKVPAEQWRRYVRQAPQLELVATEHFGRGTRAWLELIEKPSRVGTQQDLLLRIHRRLTITDSQGGKVERDFGSVGYHAGGASRLQGGWSLPLNDTVIGRLADGRHEATLYVVVEVFPGPAAHRRSGDRTPVGTVQFELTTAWLVEPAAAAESGVALRRE